MDFTYIQYRFGLPGGQDLAFKLRLDPNTFEAVESTPNAPAAWAKLENHQCPNCPLKATDRPLCPAALAFSRVLDKFNGVDAFAQVGVEVSTPERVITARLPLQRALGSLAGLLMATSGCPRTSFLRPMARFHLPFATDEETLYRAASMHLLLQYLRAKQGERADFELEELAEQYRELQKVNTAMTSRLKDAFQQGAAGRAISSLDLFSHNLPYDIRSDLGRIRRFFGV